MRVWHPELVDAVDPANWQDVLWNEAGFLWWRWTIGDPRGGADRESGTRRSRCHVFKIDGKTYSTRYAADLSSTTLVEITPSAEFIPALEGPGQLIGGGVLRVH